MRLTTIILITAIIQVNASSFAQKVTLSEKNAPLIDVLSQIRMQTGYDFIFNATTLKGANKVSIEVKNAELNDVLYRIFAGQSLDYTIEDRSVIISKQVNTALDDPLDKKRLPNLVKGTVRDEEGKPLPGVSVKSSMVTTMTSKEGKYLIFVPPNTSLIFTFIGYEKVEVNVGAKKEINVRMEQALNKLNEVIVIPYGTTEKRFFTGDATSITAADIEKQPVTNLLQALQGRVPGMVITQQNGLPGSNFNVSIRGQNSIINQNDPLYIVDDVPFNSTALGQVAGGITSILGQTSLTGDASAAGPGGLSPLNSINPADIESITILKDADATAIYGSRGANGVILITTKKGKSGPVRVTANYSTGYNTLSSIPQYLNTEQYLNYRRLALKNDGKVPGLTDYDLNGTWDVNKYTNWAKELIGHASSTTNAGISISGGNVQTQFLISTTYVKSSPTYDGDFSDQRPSLNFNIGNTSINKKFKISLSGSYSVDNNNLPGFDLTNYINIAPNTPDFRNADGTLNWYVGSAANPFANLLRTYLATTKSLQGSGLISYQVLPGLQIKSSFGYTDVRFVETRLNPFAAMNPTLPPSTTSPPSSLNGQNTSSNWIVEPQVEYKRKLYKGNLSVLIGGTLQSNVKDGQTISATGFSSDAVLANISAASKTVISNSYSKYHYEAIFARVNYLLQDRYIVNLTGRRDGSSRFGPENQFGNFGAIGAAWIFSEEGFFRKSMPFMNLGKLRGSYGITGSDQIGDYRYLDSYLPTNAYTYLGQSGLNPSRLFNPYYGWESNRKLEAAVDLEFFESRIILSASWYRNVSSNQLISESLPPTAGLSSIQENLPATVQNTGLEFQLGTTNFKNKNFNWSTSFNISFQRNKLISFPDLATSTFKSTYVVGEPVSISRGLYHFLGVNPTTGLYEFLDSKGNATTTPTANVDNTIRRNTTPTFYGGVSNSFNYKGLQLDVLLQFVKQTGLNILYSNDTGLPFSGLVNVPDFVLDKIWLNPGDNASLQKLSTTGTTGTARLDRTSIKSSDGAYTDASYIRVKNVSVSYPLNGNWIKHIALKQVRIYAQAQNLFTITNYLGLDPESQGSVLPPLRTMVFGIQLTL